MRPPIFILGNPRSGTTLLRLMLNNHKNIVVPPECGFAIWLYEKYKNRPCTDLSIQSFVKDLSNTRKIETWNLDFNKLSEKLLSEKPNSYSDMVARVYEFYGWSSKKSFLRWGDKNNFYIQSIPIIKKMFPSALLVHIIRDGRDVACSYKKLNKSNIESRYAPHLPDQINDIASEWTANIVKIRSSFDEVGWEDVYEIRYEDLTAEPVFELKKLCYFLDEPYDEEMELYFLKNQTEQQEPVEFLQWKAKTVEKPTTSEVGKYKIELTESEIGAFENIGAPLLKIYKYIP